MSRSLLAALVAALAALTPAAAWAQDGPTLSFDKPCYSPGDDMKYTGAGYTPSGSVTMFFSSLSTQTFGSYETAADAGGAIAGSIDTPDPDHFLDDDAWSGQVGVTANDDTKVAAGGELETSVGFATFELSRFEVQLSGPNGRPVRARKRMDVTAVGFTGSTGKTLYVHYRKARKTLKTLKLGRLTGDCGDLSHTLPRALPRKLPKGRYQLVFNTTKRDPQATPRYGLTQRLR